MINEKYISENIHMEFLSIESSLKKDRTSEVFQGVLDSYTKILDIHTSKKNNKIKKYVSDLDIRYIANNKIKESNDSSSYFREYSISRQKEEYEKHIQIIQELSTRELADLFSDSSFDEAGINKIIELLKSNIDGNMVKSFEQNLRGTLSQNLSININYHSLLSYLYILPSKKIQKSDIAIDKDSGKIIIFYNSNKSDFNSRKVSIIANEKDFTVSIISRENGLAKFSGTYVSKFPDGYHKIESLMETLA